MKDVLTVETATADFIQMALNDLPMLYPNLVNVSESPASGNVSKIFSIQFNSLLGDVPEIQEVFGMVNFTVNETIKGEANGSKIQLSIGDTFTNLFDFTNVYDVIE